MIPNYSLTKKRQVNKKQIYKYWRRFFKILFVNVNTKSQSYSFNWTYFIEVQNLYLFINR